MYAHVGNEACHAQLASSSHLNYTNLLAPSSQINGRDHKTTTATVTDNLKLMLFSLMRRGGAHNHSSTIVFSTSHRHLLGSKWSPGEVLVGRDSVDGNTEVGRLTGDKASAVLINGTEECKWQSGVNDKSRTNRVQTSQLTKTWMSIAT